MRCVHTSPPAVPFHSCSSLPPPTGEASISATRHCQPHCARARQICRPETTLDCVDRAVTGDGLGIAGGAHRLDVNVRSTSARGRPRELDLSRVWIDVGLLSDPGSDAEREGLDELPACRALRGHHRTVAPRAASTTIAATAGATHRRGWAPQRLDAERSARQIVPQLLERDLDVRGMLRPPHQILSEASAPTSRSALPAVRS